MRPLAGNLTRWPQTSFPTLRIYNSVATNPLVSRINENAKTMIWKLNVNIFKKCVSNICLNCWTLYIHHLTWKSEKFIWESISLKPIKAPKAMGQICWVHSPTAVLHRWFWSLPHLVKILQGAHITKNDNGIRLEIINAFPPLKQNSLNLPSKS